MKIIDRLFESARKGRAVELRAMSGGAYGGGYGGGGSRGLLGYGPEGIDYNKEAGLRWDNSIVYSILSFLVTALDGTPMITCRKDAKGVPIVVPEHRITKLLNRPNPWYDGSLMTSGCVFGEACRGNSYVYKHRNPNTNQLVALEFLPEATCFPWTRPGSGDWISEYRIATATGYWRVPPCDVLQTRWMTVVPTWPVLGMSPLDACLPDLVADLLAARHEAMIVRNSGVASLSISPLPARGDEPQPIFDLAQRTQIRQNVEDKIVGDGKGGVIVWSEPLSVQQLGFDPKQLMLTEIRHMSESRICAGYHLPPAILGFLVGLEKSNNRASIEGAISIAIEMGVLPYMRHRARQWTEDLVPELGEDGDVVMYDEAKIPQLMEKLVEQLLKWCGGPIFSVNEGRAKAGSGPVEGGDVIRGGAGNPPIGGDSASDPAADGDEATDSGTETVNDADGEVEGEAGDKLGVDSGDNGDGGDQG